MPAKKTCGKKSRCRVQGKPKCAQRATDVCDRDVRKAITSVRPLVPLVRVVRLDALIGGGNELKNVPQVWPAAVRRAVLAHYLLPRVDAQVGRTADDETRLRAAREIYAAQKPKIDRDMAALMLAIQPTHPTATAELMAAMEALIKPSATRPLIASVPSVRGQQCGKGTRRCSKRDADSLCVDKRRPCAAELAKAKQHVQGLRELVRAFQFAIDVNATASAGVPDSYASTALAMSKGRRRVVRAVGAQADTDIKYRAYVALDGENNGQGWMWRDTHALAAATATTRAAKAQHVADLRTVTLAMRAARRL